MIPRILGHSDMFEEVTLLVSYVSSTAVYSLFSVLREYKLLFAPGKCNKYTVDPPTGRERVRVEGEERAGVGQGQPLI